jgi:hypothetical protein
MMRTCLTIVFQGDIPLTVESLQAHQAAERKTIGYFVGKLRQRVGVREDFDELLTSFLERRNTLIHRADEIEGSDLGTPSGRAELKRFADQVTSDANRLTMIFAGFLRAWQLHVGLTSVPSSPELMVELDQFYAPLIKHLVYEKEDRG